MRKVIVKRQTKETNISVEINLDGRGVSKLDTQIHFLNHMLTLFSFHSFIDLKIKAQGDIEIDYHHLIEDIGLTFGEAIKKALGDKKGIKRYGQANISMDESLSRVIVDISGRPYFIYKTKKKSGLIKDLEVSLFEDFFRAVSNSAMINIHIIVEHGNDLHHIFESIFKSFGKALHEATSINNKRRSLPTTKGKF